MYGFVSNCRTVSYQKSKMLNNIQDKLNKKFESKEKKEKKKTHDEKD